MPKVTVKDGRESRTYEDEYAFVYVVHDVMDSPEGRWFQSPNGWRNGMGLFFAGIEALKAVAEQKGNEAFKVAARAALDAINGLSPESGEEDEQVGKSSRRSSKRREAE
jgi:hypothetical protein